MLGPRLSVKKNSEYLPPPPGSLIQISPQILVEVPLGIFFVRSPVPCGTCKLQEWK